VGSNGCEAIVLRLIDMREKLVVTRAVTLDDLWPAGCWDRIGDVVAAGFGWVGTVLMFSWCGLNE